jgi:hypothetical protein
MRRRDALRVSLWTAASMGGLLALLALVMIVAPHISPPLVDSRRFATVDRLTFVFGTVMITVLAVVLTWLGFARMVTGKPLSRVFWPVLTSTLALVPVFIVAALASVDLLRHGTVRWRWLAEPEVRLVSRLAFTAYVTAKGWFALVLALDEPVRPRTLALSATGLVALSALIVAAAVWV